MTDKPPLIESLRRYGSDFISHAASRGIEDIEAAGELMLDAARVLAEQPAEQEPVGKVKSISGPNYENNGLTAVFVHTDMDSTLKTGDKLYAIPQPARQPQEPSAGGVLFAVEEAIRNGDCPWQIEQAFDEYEAKRRGSTKD